MITPDDTDKALASAIETILKDASVNGVAGFTESIMTAEQYEPSTIPGVAATLPRDSNRDTGIAVAMAMRSMPMRVPVCGRTALPAPVLGGIIFVSDGAGGSPVLAFSDGVEWLRSDTRATVG